MSWPPATLVPSFSVRPNDTASENPPLSLAANPFVCAEPPLSEVLPFPPLVLENQVISVFRSYKTDTPSPASILLATLISHNSPTESRPAKHLTPPSPSHPPSCEDPGCTLLHADGPLKNPGIPRSAPLFCCIPTSQDAIRLFLPEDILILDACDGACHSAQWMLLLCATASVIPHLQAIISNLFATNREHSFEYVGISHCGTSKLPFTTVTNLLG
jgi:hypothetical protein